MPTAYPFIETIRVENGRFKLLDFHLDRMSRTCRETFDIDAPPLDLISDSLPHTLRQGVVKCRISYGRGIGKTEFEPYVVRKVRSLRLVKADFIDYHLKFACRSTLDNLRALKCDADEILIVKNGLITDTTYSNIICIAGDRLLTPRQPLLRGVMRDWLLAAGVVEEADITPEMLNDGNTAGITAVVMINSMMPLWRGPVIPLHCISGPKDQ